jgi:hypothetical protein
VVMQSVHRASWTHGMWMHVAGREHCARQGSVRWASVGYSHGTLQILCLCGWFLQNPFGQHRQPVTGAQAIRVI